CARAPWGQFDFW
nr:immunoglobulin heavy chain junction region [Macaca mulatta]MOW93424.1 immunoglobulin heavy chain junction region [Macaca mulatta]